MLSKIWTVFTKAGDFISILFCAGNCKVNMSRMAFSGMLASLKKKSLHTLRSWTIHIHTREACSENQGMSLRVRVSAVLSVSLHLAIDAAISSFPHSSTLHHSTIGSCYSEGSPALLPTKWFFPDPDHSQYAKWSHPDSRANHQTPGNVDQPTAWTVLCSDHTQKKLG